MNHPPLWVRRLSAFFNYSFPVLLARRIKGSPAEQPIPNLRTKPNLRFLVIKLDGAGDVILASPIFRLLKEAFPDSTCSVVVKSRNRALLEYSPFIEELLSPTDTSRRRFRSLGEAEEIYRFYKKTLRDRYFDAILYPRWDTDIYHGTLLLTLVDAPVKIGYVDRTTFSKANFSPGMERSLTARLEPGLHSHEITRNLGPVNALLEASGLQRTDIPGVEMFVSQADREFALEIRAKIPEGMRPVAIAIGAQDYRRVWPMERWVETLQILGRRHRLYPLIFCIAPDRPRARKLQDGLNGEAMILDRTTWTQAAAVLEHVDLVLANDSGMGHVASSMKRRIVIVSPHPLFGFEPFGENIHLLHPAAVLPPCTVQCRAPEPHCILQITPEAVAAAAEELLN